ncbi:hypothetical protein AAMO2058_000659900 [Amorphochlora amoebiformis]
MYRAVLTSAVVLSGYIAGRRLFKRGSRDSERVETEKATIKIVILGAGGFVGSRLAEKIISRSTYGSPGDSKSKLKIKEIILFDLRLSPETRKRLGGAGDPRVSFVEGDICDKERMWELLQPNGAEKVTCFHIAAVMSGPSERNFDLGLRVNLLAPMDILEHMRAISNNLDSPQTYVFTSTDYVTCYNETNIKNPCNEESFRLSSVSYGVQKACVELLVSDYSRKGFIDGRVLRLCCVVVKPGVFDVLSYPFHGVISQTLGDSKNVYKCPLPPSQSFPCSFIANSVQCLEKLGESIEGVKIGHNRVIQAPSYSFSLQSLWEGLQQVSSEMKIPVGTIEWVSAAESGSTVKTVNSCPNVSIDKARSLGLTTDFTIEDVIKDYIKSPAFPTRFV